MAGMKNFTDMMRKIKYCGPLNWTIWCLTSYLKLHYHKSVTSIHKAVLFSFLWYIILATDVPHWKGSQSYVGTKATVCLPWHASLWGHYVCKMLYFLVYPVLHEKLWTKIGVYILFIMWFTMVHAAPLIRSALLYCHNFLSKLCFHYMPTVCCVWIHVRLFCVRVLCKMWVLKGMHG
jgi:hypothetical protein